MLEAGPRAEEIEYARAAVAKAEERVRFARNRRERDKPLFDQKLLSQKDFEDSEAYLADRENELAEAKSKLAFLLAGSRPEEIDATKAEIARLEAQRRYLNQQVELARLSPRRCKQHWYNARGEGSRVRGHGPFMQHLGKSSPFDVRCSMFIAPWLRLGRLAKAWTLDRPGSG